MQDSESSFYTRQRGARYQGGHDASDNCLLHQEMFEKSLPAAFRQWTNIYIEYIDLKNAKITKQE